VVAITGGDYHYLALRSDGTVSAWGYNGYGQTNVPPDATNFVGIAAGTGHSLGLRADGTISIWGTLLNTSVTSVPASATNVVELGVGTGSINPLGLRTDGTLVAWGSSFYPANFIPAGLTNAVDVAAGGGFQVALRADGTVVVWGDNTGNQTNVPASATNLVAISAGYNHVVGLRANGTLLAWGTTAPFPPPPPGTNLISTPGASNIIAVASGANHFLALRRDGKVFAFGDNTYGQSGVPASATNIAALAETVASSLAVPGYGPPILTTPLVDRVLMSGATAYFRAMAFGASPMSYQWLMNGTNIPGATNSVLSIPGIQPSQAGTVAVMASNALGSARSRDCAVSVIPMLLTSQPTNQAAYVGESIFFTVGTVGLGPLSYQWRYNGTDMPGATANPLVLTNVQLTDAGSYSVIVSNPYVSLTSTDAVLSVARILVVSQPHDAVTYPGGLTNLSITAQSQSPLAYQWRFYGTNLPGATASSLTFSNALYSQAGPYDVVLSNALAITTNGPAILYVVPIAIWGGSVPNVPGGLSNIVAIAAGQAGMALKTDGTVSVWGGSFGQTNVPPDLTNAVMIAAGYGHCLALKVDGTVAAWGHNSYGESNVPGDLTNAVAIACGVSSFFSLAVRNSGTVVAWGDNYYGQTNAPSGLTNVIAVAGGYGHCLALRSDGTVVSWGYNNQGQTNVPTGLTNVIAVSAGEYHSLALTAEGRLVAWGQNNWNELSITNFSNVVSATGGLEYSLALLSNGTVSGAGTSSTPFPPPGLTNVLAIASSGYGMALVGDGPPAPPTPFAPLINPTWTAQRFSVSVPTRNAKVYALQYKNSLSDPDWISLPLVAGNGQLKTLTDPTASTNQRFYRVRQW
jgi:alpha-tubulin suppressor-like RCC1 family protein